MTAIAGDTTEDDRIVRESGIDARIASIVSPVLRGMGFRLVRVRLSGQNGLTLQIMAERHDGTMDVEGCEEVSRAVSPALDVEDPIEKAYHLEVSSPGIDRPLVRARDYRKYLGHEAKLELGDAIDGRKRFRGLIGAVTGDTVTITLPDAPRDTDPNQILPLAAIAEAKLVMTDKLLNMAQADQDENPIDDDEDIETIELSEEDSISEETH